MEVSRIWPKCRDTYMLHVKKEKFQHLMRDKTCMIATLRRPKECYISLELLRQ